VTEGLEESWDVLSHDPDPRVTHAELDSLPMRPGFNGDAAALGGEHDRVREEVVKDLPNPEGVCHQGRVAFLHINRKLKALRLRVRADVGKDVHQYLGDLDDLAVELELPRVHSGDVQHIVDEREKVLCTVQDVGDIRGLLLGGVPGGLLLKELREGDNAAEGLLELMTEGMEILGPGAVVPLQLLSLLTKRLCPVAHYAFQVRRARQELMVEYGVIHDDGGLIGKGGEEIHFVLCEGLGRRAKDREHPQVPFLHVQGKPGTRMGITATLDQNLNPELVKQLAVEFGFNVKTIPVEEVRQDSGPAKVEVPDIPWSELSAAMRARGAHISEVGLPSIDTTSHATGSTASSYVLRNKLWFLGGAIVTMVLLTLAVPRVKGTRSPEATPPVVDEGQRIAAISFTKASSSTMGDPRTYRKDIKPLIGVYCHKCHGLKEVAASVSLETYRNVIEYVEPGDSEKSRLYTFIQQRRNHPNPWPRSWGHTTNDKLAFIKHWIDVDWAEE